MKSASQSDPQLGFFEDMFSRGGKTVLDLVHFAGGFALLTKQIFKELFTPPFYFRQTLIQSYEIGVQSLLLVAVTALATGSVMTLQFGYGLQRFGGTLYVPKVIALITLREMGPVFTSLLVAGRIGSGIASEVASMKVTQQIDAIRALGTSPIKRIVIPRLLAALITLPLLTLIADYIGLIGAMVVSKAELNIGYEYFYQKVIETLRIYDLLTGLTKSFVFAFFIAVTACWKGLNTEGGTQGVGQSTTWVVVSTAIFIMVCDFFLTKIFILTVFPKY